MRSIQRPPMRSDGRRRPELLASRSTGFGAVRRRSGLIAFLAVLGPGLLAGLSDDDPAGITTYSVLGAEAGYQLLWVLLLSTAALIVFHDLGARMGIATGQGLAGLVRERFGLRVGAFALAALLIANTGTMCAEFAGVAASLDLVNVSRYVSVPIAAFAISFLVLRGSFHRIEHVLLALSSVFAAYIVSGILAHPDWQAAARGLVVPELTFDRQNILLATATIGTTLAPWGLAFIQGYVVDKRLRPEDLRYERIDVIVGALLTGVIGFFVVVACAATLHPTGKSIDDARDAAQGLEPLAGHLASALFGAGLLGAALLAASVLPLSTAYSVTDAVGSEGALDDSFSDAPGFYVTYVIIVVLAAFLILIPSAPLIPILYLTQALNAVLLLPLLVLIFRIVRDPDLMGEHVSTGWETWAELATIALVTLSVALLGVFSLIG
jgi:NRAMP (natural resistance-associated macrophage protein)-like metal ion transporter